MRPGEKSADLMNRVALSFPAAKTLWLDPGAATRSSCVVGLRYGTFANPLLGERARMKPVSSLSRPAKNDATIECLEPSASTTDQVEMISACKYIKTVHRLHRQWGRFCRRIWRIFTSRFASFRFCNDHGAAAPQRIGPKRFFH